MVKCGDFQETDWSQQTCDDAKAAFKTIAGEDGKLDYEEYKAFMTKALDVLGVTKTASEINRLVTGMIVIKGNAISQDNKLSFEEYFGAYDRENGQIAGAKAEEDVKTTINSLKAVKALVEFEEQNASNSPELEEQSPANSPQLLLSALLAVIYIIF